MTDVFVSYSQTDREPVSLLANALRNTGYDVWWDRHLRANQDFGREIENKLRNSNCAVVAWSAVARDSLWVRAEATEAWESRKLVQVSIDGAKPPLPFTMVHLLNLSNWNGQVADPLWSDLEDAVRAAVKGEHGKSAKPLSAPLRLAGFGPSVAVGAVSIGLVFIAGAMVGVAVTSGFAPGPFGVVTAGMFLGSLIAFAHTLTRLVKVSRASR